MEIRLLLLNLRSAAIIHEYLGPKYIPASIIGIKLKLITKNEDFIERNLERTNKMLKSIADKISFLLFVITNLIIIKSPLLLMELPQLK